MRFSQSGSTQPWANYASIRIGRYVLVSAAAAAFLGALWAINYLTVHNLWDDVADLPGGIPNKAGPHTTFILVARFVIGFGLTWLLLSIGLMAYAGLKRRLRSRPRFIDDDENIDPRT